MSDNSDIRNLEWRLENLGRTLEKTNERLKRIESCLNTEGNINVAAAVHARVRQDMMDIDKYQRRQSDFILAQLDSIIASLKSK